MIPISRTWATPLAAGAFLVMAVTGVLMFFHLDTGLNKAAHEWLGWLMVAAVVAHVVPNFASLKRHLTASRPAQSIVALAGVVLVASFLVRGAEEASPPALAMQALGRAPISAVLPLAGRTLEQARADLAAAGITLRDGSQTLQELAAGDRRAMGRAVRVLLAPPAASAPPALAS